MFFGAASQYENIDEGLATNYNDIQPTIRTARVGNSWELEDINKKMPLNVAVNKWCVIFSQQFLL